MLERARTRVVLLVTAVLVVAAVPVQAQDLWQPYIEAEARGSSIRALGQGNLMLPIFQDDYSLLFTDFRGLWTDGDAAEGNWGIAYREILSNQTIIGGYVFYDLRHSEYGNNFNQGSLGIEWLGVDWGLRGNGYIPELGTQSAPGANGAFVQGGNIVVRPGLEAAYWGVDAEGEYRLWHTDDDRSSELWVAAGVFHFDNPSTGFENITGPRLRAEYRLYDLPLLGNDSRLVLSGQYEYDQVRDSVGTAMLNVRIPLGRRPESYRLTGIERRMVNPIVRDIDIVTNAGAFGAAEAAEFASTGNPISGLFQLDGTTIDPTNVIQSAGANSLIFADGSQGPITLGETVMTSGQALVGGGSSIAVIGSTTGSAALLQAPGSRPQFISTASNTSTALTVQEGGAIVGIDLDANGAFIGIEGGSLFNVLIQNNMVTGADGDAFFFFNFGGQLTGNTATNSGNNGFSFFSVTSTGQVNGNTAANNSRFGIFVLNDVAGQINGNTARNNGFSGLRIDGRVLPTGQVNGNTAANNLQNGIYVDGELSGQVIGNTVTGNGQIGIFVFNTISGQLSNNIASNNGNDGINVFGTVSGQLNNNIASNNGGDGINVFGTVSGWLSGNTANDNGFNGIFVALGDISGQMNNNTSNNNAIDGFNITTVAATGQFNQNTASGNGVTGFRTADILGVMSDNTATSNGNIGFLMGNVFGEVSGNTAASNGFIGMQMGNVELGGTVQNNLVHNNAADGLRIANLLGTVSENTANDNGGAGINVQFVIDSTGRLNNNTANGNGAEGIIAGQFLFAGGQVNGNTANGNGLAGLRLGQVFGEVDGNLLVGNHGNGLQFVTNSGTITNNTANSNWLNGFELGDISGVFSNNSASGNLQLGYSLIGTNSGTAVNNTGAGNVGGGNTFP